MTRYIVTPVGIYINEKNTIYIISPLKKSLYEYLHTNSDTLSTV